MLTKIEVSKTYWIGMTTDQKNSLVAFIKSFSESDVIGITKGFDANSLEALDDLRQALLNV